MNFYKFCLFVIIYVVTLNVILVDCNIPKRRKVYRNKWLKKYNKWREIIKNHTEVTTEDNLTPEIKLRLITPSCTLWNADTRESPFKNIPYFGFYWAGGQGLSRYILDHPNVVKGLRVLDLGSGCGATAIAAAKAGAKSVTANDIDPIACIAIKLNAQINRVNLDISKDNFLINPESRWDVFLLGNMLCEKNESDSLVKWMNKMIRFGKQVLIGDPGRDFVKLFKGLNKLAEYSLPKHTLEMHAEFKKTKVFKIRPKRTVTTENPKYLAKSPKFVMQTNAEEPLFKFKLPKDVQNEVAKLERDERLKHKNRRTFRPRNKLNNRNRKKKKSILFEWPPPLY